MSITRHTSEEDDKLRLLEKEKLEFKRDNRYFWFVVFMMLGFVFIVGVAVWHYLK